MSTVIQKLEANSTSDLCLSGADRAVIKSSSTIAKSLEKNTSIKTIHADGYLACLRNDARSEFVEAMGKVSSLEEVFIVEGLMTISSVTVLVNNAKNLKTFSLSGIVLQGVQEDFDECEQALSQHPTLQEFRMEDVSTAVHGINTKKLTLAIKVAGKLSQSPESKAIASGGAVVQVTPHARSA